MRHLTIADDVDRQTWMHEWEWDASHNPLPLSPAFGSVYPGWMEHALHRLFAEFGMLPSGIQMRLQNGYVFTRVRPSGLPLIPPAWVLRHAMCVWWLHPTRRAQLFPADGRPLEPADVRRPPGECL